MQYSGCVAKNLVQMAWHTSVWCVPDKHQLDVQVECLTKKHHIYLTKDGRISMAGEPPMLCDGCWPNADIVETHANPVEQLCLGGDNMHIVVSGLNEAGCEYLANAIKDAVGSA